MLAASKVSLLGEVASASVWLRISEESFNEYSYENQNITLSRIT